MLPTLRLHYAPDNASLCIRLALEACGIAYETALVDRAARAQESAAYRALNPAGLIPTLETPDGPIFETAAILLWLSEAPGGNGLMPAPLSQDRGRALSWLMWLSNTLHPAARMLFYPEKFIAADAVPALAASTRGFLAERLDLIEDCAATKPLWLTPGAASAHICYLCPILRWLALYPIDAAGWYDISRWPNLKQIAKVTEMSAWAKATSCAEGLGKTPFSNPFLPNPPEGSTT